MAIFRVLAALCTYTAHAAMVSVLAFLLLSISAASALQRNTYATDAAPVTIAPQTPLGAAPITLGLSVCSCFPLCNEIMSILHVSGVHKCAG